MQTWLQPGHLTPICRERVNCTVNKKEEAEVVERSAAFGHSQ